MQNMTQNYIIMNSIFDIAQKSTKQWDCFWEERKLHNFFLEQGCEKTIGEKV